MSIQQVVKDKLLYPHFQPIVAVNEGRVVGYEALIRGPGHLGLREPIALFAAAEKAGLLRELERECWTAIVNEAARNLDHIPRWARIFLNVLPEDIRDPNFRKHVVSAMEETQVDPSRFVIEITETTRIEDYQDFNSWLRGFRELGFGIAVDDAGAGHAGLQMIAEINPDFLKIDQGLVRGIDQSIAKRAGVEALLLLARSLGMTVIAEGIESEDELQALHRLGVALGQGFLLAQPTQEMAAGIKSVPYQTRPSPWSEVDIELHGGSGRIGDIASPAPTVTPDAPLRTVMKLFESRRASDSVVLVEKGTPVGIVPRARLTQEMHRPFAAGRLEAHPASHLATAHPLIVDCDAHLDLVSRLATARPDGERYDDIVVVRDEKLVGTVSLRALLDAVTDYRLSSANHANALTGLPGHPAIEEWVRERLRARESVVLAHFDIDSLRQFNQIYGFHQGDRSIRVAADLIASEIARLTSGRGRLGHVGSDDFIGVLDAECAEAMARSLPVMFRERAALLYHPEDRARGFLVKTTETGEVKRFPLMSLTVAWIRAMPGSHQHYAELLDQLADARCVARAQSRSAQEAELRELAKPRLERSPAQSPPPTPPFFPTEPAPSAA
jgi:EAL domain-containing protein (putative c-di-GMP-specific phosphodiesterase class I)/GGDEF domain-containing protein